MNKKRYDALSGNKVVCKIIPYRNNRVAYKQTSGLDLNVYNNHFILDIQREVLQPANPSLLEADEGPVNLDTGETTSIVDLTPKQVSELDFDLVTDNDILKMSDSQLDGVPDDRKRRLSRRSSRVSRNGLLCNLMSDEKETDEFRDANARTGFVSSSRVREVNKKSKEQKGDAF